MRLRCVDACGEFDTCLPFLASVGLFVNRRPAFDLPVPCVRSVTVQRAHTLSASPCTAFPWERSRLWRAFPEEDMSAPDGMMLLGEDSSDGWREPASTASSAAGRCCRPIVAEETQRLRSAVHSIPQSCRAVHKEKQLLQKARRLSNVWRYLVAGMRMRVTAGMRFARDDG